MEYNRIKRNNCEKTKESNYIISEYVFISENKGCNLFRLLNQHLILIVYSQFPIPLI